MASKLTTLGLQYRQESGYERFLYLAVGTGSQTPSEALTDLVAQISITGITGFNVVGAQLALAAMFTNNQGNGTLKEWGIKDAAAGSLLQYGIFDTPHPIKDNTTGMLLRVTAIIANG